MSNQLTVIDSSVLINAAVGPNPARRMRALSIIADPNRKFAATRFLKLEVLPIPAKYQKQKELSLYQRFFSNITT
ncbi:MAG: hypothetical protein ACREEM_18520 [Blastocatellia bacterium]